MLTDAKFTANQANAQPSTGPRTPEGKAAVSQNSPPSASSPAPKIRPNTRPANSLLHTILFAQFRRVDQIFGPSGGIFIAKQGCPSDEMDGYSIELPRFLFRPRLFEGDACNGRHEIDPVRFEPELNHFAGNSQIVDGNTEAPHAEIGNGPQYECRVLRRRPEPESRYHPSTGESRARKRRTRRPPDTQLRSSSSTR